MKVFFTLLWVSVCGVVCIVAGVYRGDWLQVIFGLMVMTMTVIDIERSVT